jgi:serine/threonine protein kinase
MSNTKVVATKATFPLPDGYEFKRHLGSGAYGTVCACANTKTGEDVAVKRISKVFDRKILTKRTLREIKLLRHFAGHENITCVYDIFKLGEGNDFNEVYMVQELMEADLHQIIRSHQKLTNSHFQYFIYQILRGLKYIHSAQVRRARTQSWRGGEGSGLLCTLARYC